LLIVLGTSSSETVLPDMMRKLEDWELRVCGWAGFPTIRFQYGWDEYLSDAGGVVLAQATNTHFAGQISGILLFALVASKGGIGVTDGL